MLNTYDPSKLPDYTPSKANWDLIPDYMRSVLRKYIEHGIPPGHFLTAVLTNNLRRAFEAADDYNSSHVREYVEFLYCYCPSECWGSPVKVDAWIKSGGLVGQRHGEADDR